MNSNSLEQNQQPFPNQIVARKSLDSNQHPEVLLNRLSTNQKLNFLDKFNFLSKELQLFAYNKFISSAPNVQEYAINQFLSLTKKELSESIKGEYLKETGISRNSEKPPLKTQLPQLPQNRFSLKQTTSPQLQLEKENAQPLVETELELFQAEASRADQLALKQQLEALKQIIAQQNKINSQNQ